MNFFVHIIWNNVSNCFVIGHISPSESNIFALIFKVDLLVISNENNSFTNSWKSRIIASAFKSQFIPKTVSRMIWLVWWVSVIYTFFSVNFAPKLDGIWSPFTKFETTYFHNFFCIQVKILCFFNIKKSRCRIVNV